MSNVAYGTGAWDEAFPDAAEYPSSAAVGPTETGATVLRQGHRFVLIEVRDGYQIWDRQDYFSSTPQGCPCDYFQLTEVGEFAAWSAFYALEPAIRTADASQWDGDGPRDAIALAVFCTSCGVELTGEGRFCSSCGVAVVITVIGQ
jgi:hypothetical protein